MLKGDSNTPYGNRSCPGGGHFNHHEPVLGIGSNHSLSDSEVYEDDWIIHLSDENEKELVTYYRRFGSLEDGFAMEGNCKDADPTRSCAYPCFYDQVTYGIAVKGFSSGINRDEAQKRLPVRIDVDRNSEPDSRDKQAPVMMKATVTIQDLTPGSSYNLYRYNGFNSFPSSGTAGYDSKVSFTAANDTWRFQDSTAFLSNGAVYYVAAAVATPAQPAV